MYNFCEIILKKHVWPAIICFYLRLGLIYIYLPHFFSLPHFLFVLSSSSLSKEKIRMKLISSRYVIIIYYLYKYIRSLSSRIYRFNSSSSSLIKVLELQMGCQNALFISEIEYSAKIFAH